MGCKQVPGPGCPSAFVNTPPSLVQLVGPTFSGTFMQPCVNPGTVSALVVDHCINAVEFLSYWSLLVACRLRACNRCAADILGLCAARTLLECASTLASVFPQINLMLLAFLLTSVALTQVARS